MIQLNVNSDVRSKNIQRCRERGITLPTFKQMKNPETIPSGIQAKLKNVGLWDVNPLNLYRITWNNEPIESGGGFSGVNYIELPP